jgi:hypothetical protein
MDALLLTVSAATAGAVLVLTVALGAVWISARRSRRTLLGNTERVEQQLAQLREDLLGIATAQQPLAERVASLAATIERERVLGTSQAGSAQRAYDLAARMAANGAARDDLVASCGLTSAEADLAMRVHRSRLRGRAVA